MKGISTVRRRAFQKENLRELEGGDKRGVGGVVGGVGGGEGWERQQVSRSYNALK